MKKSAFIKYVSSSFLFGLNGIVASFIALDSTHIVLLRTLLGSAFLILLFLVSGGRFTFYKHKKQSLFLAISGVAMGASWMFLYEAYARIGVSIATLIYYCGPVIVMVLSPIVFKEKLTLPKIIGFLAVLGGVFLINGNAFEGKGDVFGIVCGLLSAVTYAFMVIFNKKAENITGLENSALQLLISFLTVAVFIGVTQGFGMSISRSDILPALILGLINTGIGCWLYFSSIGDLPVQTVAVCGYLEPLSAVLFSVILLNETMTVIEIAGAVLILGGALFGELKKRGFGSVGSLFSINMW